MADVLGFDFHRENVPDRLGYPQNPAMNFGQTFLFLPANINHYGF